MFSVRHTDAKMFMAKDYRLRSLCADSSNLTQVKNGDQIFITSYHFHGMFVANKSILLAADEATARDKNLLTVFK